MDILELQPELSFQQWPDDKSISRHSFANISYSQFYWQFMKKNWPVILTEVSCDWECSLKWTNRNSIGNSAINYDYLRKQLKDCMVPVADCRQKYYNSHSKKEMKFYDFLNYWKEKCKEEELSNENHISQNLSLYLKDWHLRAQRPDYEFYKVPKHFGSDWLNEWLLAKGSDDYCFVYMGPKGSWTPFHTDVFGSFSWSTNIVGCKKWLLLPAGEERKLTDSLGNLPFEIDEKLLDQQNVKYFTILQSENEALFVPSGWYHQVWNSSDTISINHNWFNACNIMQVWRNLASHMRQVETEIEDCKQMDNFKEHCQIMLRSCFGMNYLDFLDMLQFIAERRLNTIDNENNIVINNTTNTTDNINNTITTLTSSSFVLFNKYTLNDYHKRHDLHSIHQVVENMLLDHLICNNNNRELYQRCQRLMQQTKMF